MHFVLNIFLNTDLDLFLKDQKNNNSNSFGKKIPIFWYLTCKSDIDFWTKIELPKYRLIGEYIRYVVFAISSWLGYIKWT
jgi:hypothetical protein